MTKEINPEQERAREQDGGIIDDNARKFTLPGIEAAWLDAQEPKGYHMITDWIETEEDTEEKVVDKQFDNGTNQRLYISKITEDGKRRTKKDPINEERYSELVASSRVHVEKIRHEFDYVQNGVVFKMKYDEFINSPLRVLEVEDDTALFNFDDFPFPLEEVTGEIKYVGYRVADIV